MTDASSSSAGGKTEAKWAGQRLFCSSETALGKLLSLQRVSICYQHSIVHLRVGHLFCLNEEVIFYIDGFSASDSVDIKSEPDSVAPSLGEAENTERSPRSQIGETTGNHVPPLTLTTPELEELDSVVEETGGAEHRLAYPDQAVGVVANTAAPGNEGRRRIGRAPNAKKKPVNSIPTADKTVVFPSRKKEFPCKACEKVFIDKLSLARHTRWKHVQTGEKRTVEDASKVEKLRDGSNENIDRCRGVDAPSRQESIGTRKAKRRVTSSGCTLSSSSDIACRNKRESIDGQSKKSKKRKIPCFLCEASFRLKGRLRKHLNEAHLEDALLCPLCDRSCDNFPQLSQHLKQEHRAGPVTLCDWCGQYFVDEEQLVKHAKERHQRLIETQGCPLCAR